MAASEKTMAKKRNNYHFSGSWIISRYSCKSNKKDFEIFLFYGWIAQKILANSKIKKNIFEFILILNDLNQIFFRKFSFFEFFRNQVWNQPFGLHDFDLVKSHSEGWTWNQAPMRFVKTLVDHQVFSYAIPDQGIYREIHGPSIYLFPFSIQSLSQWRSILPGTRVPLCW